MNRIKLLREYIDKILFDNPNELERRCVYPHLYGVSQFCALLAKKRGENAELAVMAGLLHDIYSYVELSSKEHAHKGASLAREILTSLNITNEEETNIICEAIYNHSDKNIINSSFDEVLKDADVMQHCLYDVLIEPMEHEKERFKKLKEEFNII